MNAVSRHPAEAPSLLESIGDGLAITRGDGSFSYCSAGLATAMGPGAGSSRGETIFDWLESVSGPGLPELHERVESGGETQRTQVRGRRTAGATTVFNARVVMRRAELPEGPVVVWSFEDIGRGQPSFTEFALSGTDIGLWDWEIQPDRLTWVNNWAEQAGLTAYAGEGHEKLWTARMYPEDLPAYQAALTEHLAGRTPVFDVEYRLRDRQDSWVWIRERGRVIERDAAGTAIRMVGLCLDADERHRAASELERSESRLALAARRTDFGFWDVDLATDSLSWWNDWCTQLDLDPCAGEGHSPRWDAIIHPDDLANTMNYYELAAGLRELYEAEYRVRTRTGGWRWVLSRGMATARDAFGRALRITGVTIDIDARKRAELALRESEARLEAAVWGTELGLWEVRSDGTCWWFNDWCADHGIEPHDSGGRKRTWVERIHPDDAPLYRRLTDESAAGISDHYVVEFRIRTRSGAWRWVHERGRVAERDSTGGYVRIVGVCIDIDGRKQMEAALRHAEQRYEMAINAAQLPVWEVDLDTRAFRGNTHWHRAIGHGPTDGGVEERCDRWPEDIHPEDLPKIADLSTQPTINPDGFFENELRFRTRADGFKWFLVRGQVTERDAFERPVKIVGIAVDIDARKRMDIAVRDSESRLAMILTTMQEGVVLTDAAGRVEFTNPAFDEMFGHETGTFAGRSLLDLLDPRQAAKLRIPCRERLPARPNARAGKRGITLRRRDGTQFAAEVLTGSLELSGDRKTLYVMQDVSERRHLEKEITEIAHSERRRLGNDLHDGLGQELTGISLMLRSLVRRTVSGGDFSADLDEVIRFVNHAIETTRTMAMGLSPVTLERGGFVSALGTLAAWSRTTLGVEVRLRPSLRGELNLDEAHATHLYLIAQEAILNAVKHGNPSSIVVTLRVTPHIVSLSVIDDGSGIGAPARAGSGMGLKIMEYRAGIIGGSLQVRRRKGRGTRVRCVCPQPAGNARTDAAERITARRTAEALPLQSE
jgi:PAS domain S-box-containing protein